MRLEVLCEDRLGLTRELLDILASRNIDLRGIEIDISGIIYLNCPDSDFATFSELMTEIRRITGVKDVRKIQFMPMERHNTELISLLDNLPDCVLSINLKGEVDMANLSAIATLNKPANEVIDQPISHLVPTFNFPRWIEGSKARLRDHVVLEGLDYQLEVTPVYITGESKESTLAGAMMMLKPMKGSSAFDDRVPLDSLLGFEHFVGVSHRHKTLLNQAKKLSSLDQPLLIEGETGTGKEMLARACHHRSPRGEQPFLVVNCASMPDDVAETELFGRIAGNTEPSSKGIFELANGGTVFLDEIGEMSPHLQIKLLRFLQDGTFRRVGEEQEIHLDVRVIASTRHQLLALSDAGSFREDLYYRLNVLTLRIPPLRDRPSDIAPLLELFITKHSRSLGISRPEMEDTLLDELAHYHWPGNMRQLDNMVLRALTEIQDEPLGIGHFHLPHSESTAGVTGQLFLDGSLDDIMKTYEHQVLDRLYQSFPSSRKLAKRLDVSHTSIANKLREYGIKKR
ncbi:transcriptional regulator TyrR [Vibrio zhugei]|uniref:HTH-type transcriptional regulatory protein TyrR n=1 Tax=Vibrio zhugei TaxID=2479546 RepID=A0ABV7C7M6_9VIBR|nr:transcriptional regulator TyrR [Vibrio zhugei]